MFLIIKHVVLVMEVDSLHYESSQITQSLITEPRRQSLEGTTYLGIGFLNESWPKLATWDCAKGRISDLLLL